MQNVSRRIKIILIWIS